MDPTGLERLAVLKDEEIREGFEFEPIGSGGYGTVYKVQNPQKTVVIARKLSNPIAGRVNDAVIESFKNEIRAANKLCNGSHANLIRVYTSGLLRPSHSLFFIDMDYCEGNLRDHLEGESLAHLPVLPMETPTIQIKHLLKEVMYPVLSGLKFIHDNGEVHRDLKPENILYLARDRNWKIADFGLTSPGYTSLAVATSRGRGGPCYRAPELVREVPHPSFTKKLDIWAMGCILYEVCVGTKLFASDGATLVFSLERKEVETDLNHLIEEEREPILNAIKSTLKINPSDRPSIEGLTMLIDNCLSKYPSYFSPSEVDSICNETSTDGDSEARPECMDGGSTDPDGANIEEDESSTESFHSLRRTVNSSAAVLPLRFDSSGFTQNPEYFPADVEDTFDLGSSKNNSAHIFDLLPTVEIPPPSGPSDPPALSTAEATLEMSPLNLPQTSLTRAGVSRYKCDYCRRVHKACKYFHPDEVCDRCRSKRLDEFEFCSFKLTTVGELHPKHTYSAF